MKGPHEPPLPPSPFITPEKNRYKEDTQELIRITLERELSSLDKVQELASYVLYTDSNLLTEEEVEQFRVFFIHNTKRILNAYSHKENGIQLKLILSALTGNTEKTFPYLFHDLAHTVGMIASKQYKEQENSTVPSFLKKVPGYDYNDNVSFEEELYTGLLSETQHTIQVGNIVKVVNMPTAIAALQKANTFEEYKQNYIEDLTERTLGENELVIKDSLRSEKKRYREEAQRQQETYGYDIAKKVESAPPEELIRLLTYVWDHRDNPRVLADLFFKEVGPYITELQKRKGYSPATEMK